MTVRPTSHRPTNGTPAASGRHDALLCLRLDGWNSLTANTTGGVSRVHVGHPVVDPTTRVEPGILHDVPHHGFGVGHMALEALRAWAGSVSVSAVAGSFRVGV